MGLWFVLAIAVCIKCSWHGDQHSVYPVFAAGSKHWWADKSLYADYRTTEDIDGYRYSPAFAVAFTPLTWLPHQVGAAAWSLLSIALLFWALHQLARQVLPHDAPRVSNAPQGRFAESAGRPIPSPAWEGTFLTLTAFGSVIGIWSGQTNAIVPALIGFGLVALVNERWWSAATFLAVPVFIKIWPLAMVLLLAACWPRQLIGRLLAVSGVLALIPFLTRPPQIVLWQYQEWYRSLVGPLQGRWGGYRDAWTIWEEVAPLFGLQSNWSCATSRPIYMGIQLATSLAVLVWCLWQRKRIRTPGHLLTVIYAMWASWQLLFGPGTEQLTYGLIAPATSWAVLTSLAEKKARCLTVGAWAMLAFLPSGDIEATVLRFLPAGRMLLPLGVMLYLGWLVWHERGSTGLTRQGIEAGADGLPSPIGRLPS